MEGFDTLLTHLGGPAKFLDRPHLRERFIACYLLAGIGEVFIPLFQNMSCSYQDWRWLSLVDAVAQVS